MRYNPAIIEPKWQAYWQENKTFAAPREPGDKKLYALDMFPYPSSEGLHVGHPEGYTATDIVCRFERMNGTSVLHPMGWDAFGLPAEQHAKRTGIHPRTTTEKNISTFKRQLKMLGFSYDWDREIATTDLAYFRWTQHIFLVLFDTWFDPRDQKGKPISELPIPSRVAQAGEEAIGAYRDEHRLAYQIEAPVNWCPALGTVLANEEVIGGLSERGNHPVVRMPLRQWMLRITAYADRLEKDLDLVDWTESIKLLQRNWIGRSSGAEVDFFIGLPYTEEEIEIAKKYSEDELNELRRKYTPGVPTGQAFEVWKGNRKELGYPEKAPEDVIRVFTTRPDTLFGATYMVIAPEHPLVERLTLPRFADEVKAYCEQAARKSELDRTGLAKEKTGVFTGSFAINPVTKKAVPIWIADYVLGSYGTGAIMSVPAHDTRDFEFAQQFGLPIIEVVVPPGAEKGKNPPESAFTEPGIAVNSGAYDGTPTAEFKPQITADLFELGLGKESINYKMRDWLFSRQHFWGEPFPILREIDENGVPTGRIRAMKPEELPLDLPKAMEFDAKHNSPKPPLDFAPPEWLFVNIDGVRYKRETNTMPQWAGSCWYYLRFIDPENAERFIEPELEKKWMPVDLYVGGAEHAVLHLLYARFWHKVLFDRGYVSMPEPFQKLVNQGMILGETEFTLYKLPDGTPISAAELDIDKQGIGTRKSDGLELASEKIDSVQAEKKGEGFVWKENPSILLDSRALKMSKSRGNVVNPDDVVNTYGADSLRLYEMFMGPLESVKPWSMDGVNGVRNFLDRVWRMLVRFEEDELVIHPWIKEVDCTEEQNRILHQTIKGVGDDIRLMHFNTAISKMMEFTNFFTRQEVRPKAAMEKFVLLLSPFAPHICEELWELLGHKKTLAYESWPKYEEEATREATLTIPIQVNGKLRATVSLPADADKETMEKTAKEEPKIVKYLEGKTIVKTIVVPGKMVNFVIK